MEAMEMRDLESFTQTHLIAENAIHAYARLERGRILEEDQRTILMHPSKER